MRNASVLDYLEAFFNLPPPQDASARTLSSHNKTDIHALGDFNDQSY